MKRQLEFDGSAAVPAQIAAADPDILLRLWTDELARTFCSGAGRRWEAMSSWVTGRGDLWMIERKWRIPGASFAGTKPQVDCTESVVSLCSATSTTQVRQFVTVAG